MLMAGKEGGSLIPHTKYVAVKVVAAVGRRIEVVQCHASGIFAD